MYPAAGAEDDWAKGKAGIKFSYTMELRPGNRICVAGMGLIHTFYDIDSFKNILDASY